MENSLTQAFNFITHAKVDLLWKVELGQKIFQARSLETVPLPHLGIQDSQGIPKDAK